MIDYKTKEDLAAFLPTNERPAATDVSWWKLANAIVALVFVVISWLLVLLIAAAAVAANAEELPGGKLWVTPGAMSYHFNRSKGYNEKNFGFGIEYHLNENWSIATGQYQNSMDRPSRYALVGYTPWCPFKHVAVGALVGAVTGYRENGGVIFAALPVVSVQFRHIGANISFVPPFHSKVDGAIGVQIKFRF